MQATKKMRTLSQRSMPAFGILQVGRVARWAKLTATFCVLALAAGTGIASAQQAGEAESSESVQSAPPAGIEEITVTVTKRDESLHDVPAAVTAMSGEQVQEANIQRSADLAIMIPNVLTKGSNETESLSVRGISLGFKSIASSVAQHINGVFYGKEVSSAAMRGSWYDLEGVEFLRGPSGVAYGRNGTAGAMDLKWKNPHSGYEVFGDVGFGSRGLREARVAANFPFLGEGNERLTGRFVATQFSHDGVIESPHLSDDEDGAAADNFHFRGALRSQLAEDLTATFRGHYSTYDANPALSSPSAFVDRYTRLSFFPIGLPIPWDPYYGYRATKEWLDTPLGHPIAEFVLARTVGAILGEHAAFYPTEQAQKQFILSRIMGLGPDDYGRPDAVFPGSRKTNTNSIQQHGGAGGRARGWNGEIEWRLREVGFLGDLKFNLLGGWVEFLEDTRSETDGSRYRILDSLGDKESEGTTFELRISSESDGPFNWTAGYFWFEGDHADNSGRYDPDEDPDTCFGTWVTETWCNTGGDIWEVESSAVFGQFAWRPADRFEIFGGARYNTDEHEDIESKFEEGVEVKKKFTETTGEVGFRWFLSDDHMAFLKWARGYKSGYSLFDDDSGPYGINPELVDAWETGLRSEFMDRRVLVGLTAFFYDYTDLQVQKITALQVRTENAGEADIWGLELEMTLLPVPEWRTQLSIGYLETEIGDYCSADELGLNSSYRAFGYDALGPWIEKYLQDDPWVTDVASEPGCDPGVNNIEPLRNLDGKDLEDAPNWQAALRTSYRWDLSDRGSLTGILTSSWTDDYYLTPFNRDIDKVDAYTRTDVRLVWRDADEGWWAEAFVENIEDETVYLRLIQTSIVRHPTGYGFVRPRFYGMRVGFHWGSEN